MSQIIKEMASNTESSKLKWYFLVNRTPMILVLFRLLFGKKQYNVVIVLYVSISHPKYKGLSIIDLSINKTGLQAVCF